MWYVGTALLLINTLAGISAAVIAAEAQVCPSADHPIYCAITGIQPAVDKEFAMQLSDLIYKYSKRYNTDPIITVGIIAQESMFRNIHRKQDIVLYGEECDDDGKCVEYTKLATGYTDIGLYQFHARTIQAYSMDALRLRDDLEYATQQHCYLLSVKLKECSALGKEAWSCYHSATPKYREKYVRMVNRHLNKINYYKETNHE